MIFNNKLFVITCIILSCASIQMQAQQGFEARAILGFNASQIRGDQLAGYDKLGLYGGVQVVYPLNSRWDVGIELAFSQKGSQAELSLGTPIDVQRTTLNYLEIPVIAIIKDWYIEDGGYYKVKAHGGFSYARLFDVKSSNGLFENDTGNFKKNDFAIIIGLAYAFKPKLDLGVRYSNSLVKIYNNDLLQADGLINYLWSFTLSYKL